MTSASSSPEVALVTGATSGIGKAVAIALAARGASVGLVGRNEAAAEEVAATIAAAGGTALVLPADVSRSEQVGKAVATLVERFGGLDTVVSSAGIAITGSIVDISEQDYLRTIGVNLHGTVFLARHTLPHLLKRGGGAFVAVGSDAGLQGASGFSAYCASKFGVTGLIKSMALDFGPKGIRSNAIAPGFVETPMADALLADLSDEEREYYRKSVPLGRFAVPADVANLVLFLSSPAGGYLNGAIIPLEGGATAGYFSPPA